MATSIEKCIFTFAFFSRLIILFVQFAGNWLIPDHDAEAFNPPVDEQNFSGLDHALHALLGGVRRWDAVYFMHIAQYGYTYEKCAAFFPMYPMTVSATARLFSKIFALDLSSWNLISAVTVNVVLFSATARSLYILGRRLLRSDSAAFYAALLFCFNPATIFMTAAYSETMFMFFSIHALLRLSVKDFYTSSLLFGLSCLTRSNGLLGVGFLLHAMGQDFLGQVFAIFNSHSEQRKTIISLIPLTLRTFVQVSICLCICLAPFLGYQFYIYRLFCFPTEIDLPIHLVSFGVKEGLKTVGSTESPWCDNAIPLSYSYIQNSYWDVGLFTYFQWKQIPNFLLAAPVVFLSIKTCLYFAKENVDFIPSLGLLDGRSQCTIRKERKHWKKIDFKEEDDVNRADVKEEKMDGCLIAHGLHLFALTVFGCCVMHIQVLTRLLISSCPLLMWYCGSVLATSDQVRRSWLLVLYNHSSSKIDRTTSWIARKFQWIDFSCFHFVKELMAKWSSLSGQVQWIFIYFFGYCFIGTIMFANFLPWT